MSDTEIFRFMYVKPATLKDGKELKEKSIELDTTSKLLSELIKLKEKGEIENLLSKAKDAFENEKVFNEINAFQDEFIEEESLLKWVMTEIDDNSISVSRVKNELTKQTIDLSKINELWNALIIHSLLDNPIGIIDLLVGLIKLEKLIAKIDTKEVTNRKGIIRIMESNVVLPKSLFPISYITKSESNNDDAESVPEDKEKEIIKQVEKLEKAKKELTNVFKTKLNTLKNKAISFEEFEQQQSYNDNISENFKDKENTKKESVVSKNKESIKKGYEKLIEQRNATRLTSADSKKLSEYTVSVLKDMPFEKLEDQEISDIVNQIDDNKAELVGQLRGGTGYTVSIIDRGIEYNVPRNLDENCLKDNTGESYCTLLKRLRNEDPTKPIVNVLGIGDYKVIRQKLLRYEAGEIAHIKNVFAGEEFERSHRDLKRTEELYESETERETEEKNEISTSDRFEMSKEISEQQNKSSQKELGVSLTASYGPVLSVSANASFSSSASSSISSKSASKFARETTEKASNSLREKTKEKRSKTSINEIEIINSYKLINENPEHKIGKYMWVDKFYENQVYNLGKRLMLEFYIPSPLAFYMFSKQGAKSKGVSLKKPIHPKDNFNVFQNKALTSFKDITRENVDKWLLAYNVTDYKIPPSEFVNVGEALNLEQKPDINWNTQSVKDIEIPNGYEAIVGTLNIGISGGNGRYLAGYIGRKYFSTNTMMTQPMILALNNEVNKLPVSFRGHYGAYNMNIGVTCQLSEKSFQQWQFETFTSIMEAYENMQSEYEGQIATAQIQAGIQIDGNNPDINRQIEIEELQKWCTEALLLDRFENWNAMKKAITGQPEIDFNQVKKETPIVSFMNTAFEWESITYKPYPYFYGNKKEHPVIRELTDTDPKFMAMLKAGYCRVIVPVSYGFETAALHLISTGQVWNGGNLPVLGDPLFQSIVDEIKGEEYDNIGTAEGTPWETKVSTNLVWLNNNQPEGQL